MKTLRLGAKAEGTKMPASLPKKRFLGFTPMSPDTLEKKAWLFLQAGSPRDRLNPEAKSVLDSLDGVAARLQQQLNEACMAGYPPSERMRMDRMLSVYQGTFEQLRIYERMFASLCGPREILEQESEDAKFNAEQQLKKPGIAGFLEKYVVPLAIGGAAGGASAASGFGTWAAGRILDLAELAGRIFGLMNAVGAISPQKLAATVDVVFAGAFIALVAAVSKRRTRIVEKKRNGLLKQIGQSGQEIKKAIVSLVVLEYQRLATQNAIRVGMPVESEAIINRKMEQIVFTVKKKYGFELPLPAVVENDVWPLLHMEHPGFLKKTSWAVQDRYREFRDRRYRANLGPHASQKIYPVDMRSLCAIT